MAFRSPRSSTWPYKEPEAPPTFSVTKPFSRSSDLPWLTDEQFTQVWEVFLQALSLKDFPRNAVVFERWRRDLAQHFQGYRPFEKPLMPLCPLVPTGKLHIWLAKENLRPNIFSSDEITRLNKAISVILGVKPPLF